MVTEYSCTASLAMSENTSAAARGIIPIASGWMELSVYVLPAPVCVRTCALDDVLLCYVKLHSLRTGLRHAL